MSNNQKKFIYSNLSGGINTSASRVGLLGNSKKLFWDDSYNVEIYKNFGVASVKGSVKIAQDTDNESILGIAQVGEDTTDFIYLTKNGKMCYFSDDLSIATEIKTLNAPPERFCAINFLNGVLVLTGTNRIQYVKTGATPEVSEVVIVGVDGSEVFGQTIAQYASRVWVSDGSILYFSSLGTYDIWDEAENAGYIANFHTSTTEIVAMTEYAGKLAIYKPDGVYLLSGLTVEDFTISKLGNIGAMSTGSVVSANNKQFFISRHGIFALEQFGELAQIGVNTEISVNINNEFLNFDLEKLPLATVLHNYDRNQIWFFTPHRDFAGISEVLIYDYLNHAWCKRRIPFDIQCASTVKGKILTGSSDGAIFMEDIGNTFSGKPIKFSFSTPFFHFGQPNTRKTVEVVNLILDEKFQNSFKFSVCKDFTKASEADEDYMQTISPKSLVFASKEGTGGNYNAVWADNENGDFAWAEPIEDGMRVEVFDSNTSFQLNISSSELGDSFGLVGIEFSEITFD